MEARSAEIQRPSTNWLRTTVLRRALAVAAITAAIVGPASKAGAAASVPTFGAGANMANTQPADNCQWANKDGRRQFPVSTNPVTVRVDGSCDPDPNAPIGIYPTAEQAGQPLALVKTGDNVTVECYVPNGQVIQDVRGDATDGDEHVGSSPVWLKVKAPDGTTGKIPETWTGFPGISALASNGVPECPTQ